MIPLALLDLSATDIERAKQIIEEAKKDAAFGPDFAPNVRIVGGDHWAFATPAKAKRIAMAARDEDGKEWILLNRDSDPQDLDSKVEHELGHLAAWRKYGEGIKEHGSQFRNECRKLVKKRPGFFCKGYK